MRIAFIGKGGAGKSTIASTMARLLAQRGRDVVAVDSDPMPGLCFGLNLPVVERPIPDDAVVEKSEGEAGPRYRLHPGIQTLDALRLYSAVGADGVRLLTFGKTRGEWGDIARGQHAWSQILDELTPDVAPHLDIIGDLPGGTRQPMTGWGKYADVLIIVVEPNAKSINTARRLASLQRSKWSYREVVAVVNRAASSDDAAMVAERTGLQVIGSIPFDVEVGRADRLGLATLDTAPNSAFVRAITMLTNTCIDRFDSAILSKEAVA